MDRVDSKYSFDVLNGLRGVAAICVVNAHLSDYFAHIKCMNVGLAVDFFFVLSGFVLSHAYGDSLKAGLRAGRFMLMRLVRLYPLYLVGTAIGAAAFWFYGKPAPEHFAVSSAFGALFLPPPPSLSVNDYNLYPFDFPAWSLFFELIANLVLALIGRRLNNTVLASVIGLSFLGLVAVGLTAGTLDQGVRPMQAAGGLARVMFSFFAGVALYRLWRARPVKLNLHPLIMFVLLVLPLVYMPPKPYEWPYDLAVIVVYFPLLVMFGAQAKAGPAWTAIATVLGAISYPLYVLHVAIWHAIKPPLDATLEVGAPWTGLAMLTVLLVISWLAEIYLDLPLRRFVGKRLRRKP